MNESPKPPHELLEGILAEVREMKAANERLQAALAREQERLEAGAEARQRVEFQARRELFALIRKLIAEFGAEGFVATAPELRSVGPAMREHLGALAKAIAAGMGFGAYCEAEYDAARWLEREAKTE